MKALLLFLMMLLTALFSITGCRETANIPTTDCRLWVEVGSVQIIMATDTLRFLPGDSASAQGFVLVKDDQGRGMAGVKVNLTLTEPFGWIEYVDNALRDTTGANGRVDFRFRTYNQVGPGYNTVTATVGSKQDSWTLWVQPAANRLVSMRITVSAGAIRVGDGAGVVYAGDPVIVTVTISDSGHHAIEGISLPLCSSSGHFTPFTPTDASGRSTSTWFPDCCGRQCLCIRAWNLIDSVCVMVMDTTGTPAGRRRL